MKKLEDSVRGFNELAKIGYPLKCSLRFFALPVLRRHVLSYIVRMVLDIHRERGVLLCYTNSN